MANSLRVKLKKLCHDGKIEQSELDVLLSKLDGHDQQIRNDISEIQEKAYQQGRADQLKEDCEITINLKGGVLAEHDKQIRNEAIQNFAEWLEKMDYLNEVNVEYDYEEHGYEVCLGLTKDDVLSQYEEHLKKGEQRMNKTGLDYLRYRLDIAKECEADLIKIDVEELASALGEVDEFLASDKMIVNRDDFTEDLINQGYNKALNDVIEVMSADIVDCKTCPIVCKGKNYTHCETHLRRYVLEQIKERD